MLPEIFWQKGNKEKKKKKIEDKPCEGCPQGDDIYKKTRHENGHSYPDKKPVSK